MPWDSEAAWSAVQKYRREILENARAERRAYLAYLESQGVCLDGRQAFVDFVAGGTVQHYLSSLLGREADGYYAATVNLPNSFYREGAGIQAAYGNITSYGSLSSLAEHYLLLEAVLTDPDSTFRRVRADGTLEFEPEANVKFARMQKVQRGILEFVEDYCKFPEPLWDSPYDLEYGDQVFGCLFDGSVQVDAGLRKSFTNDDRYDGTPSRPVWSQ